MSAANGGKKQVDKPLMYPLYAAAVTGPSKQQQQQQAQRGSSNGPSA